MDMIFFIVFLLDFASGEGEDPPFPGQALFYAEMRELSTE
jgi:hypothetical protein